MMKDMRRLVILLLSMLFVPQVLSYADAYGGKVKRIDIVNWTHTDYGFTDSPLIVTELQKRYIDIALDYAVQSSGNKPGERFTWTVEALDPLWQWWQEASHARRRQLLKSIDRGQIDVNIMPFNIHPCCNETEIEQLLAWIPDDLRKRLKISVAIQNDVNGFPRAVAERLKGKGVDYIWLGMNGHHPFDKPTLSEWEMKDGSRIWLWNGGSYWDAYDYFSRSKWRTWQCEASNLMYRWPRRGEMLQSDEASVMEAHKICLGKLNDLERKGYLREVLPITFSNQWRCDNDGPYYGIVEFVKTWNKLGLAPELRLVTAAEAMKDLTSGAVPDGVVSGEFGDWWAFGMTSLPREHSAARSARWALQAAVSGILGKMQPNDIVREENINRSICTFYEHTFASMFASSKPYGEFNQGTITECNRFAYDACENAKWLLAQRVRRDLCARDEGIYVYNTQKVSYSGWVRFDFISLRNKSAAGVKNVATGLEYRLVRHGTDAWFWIDGVPPESVTRFVVVDTVSNEAESLPEPEIVTDEYGWPVSAKWPGMDAPLFQGQVGMLHANSMVSGGWWAGNAVLKEAECSFGSVSRTETPFSVVFTQAISSALTNKAVRTIEIYKGIPHARVIFEYDRILHPERTPEMFYVEFPFPDSEREVRTSNGGSVFTPYEDNIDNTCNAFYVTDSWVSYKNHDGYRVWSSPTSPIVCFGNMNFFGVQREPSNTNLLFSMVYNNGWGVNFPMEYPGTVRCEYDLAWSGAESLSAAEIQSMADTYSVRPVVAVNPSAKEDVSYRRWLNGEAIR